MPEDVRDPERLRLEMARSVVDPALLRELRKPRPEKRSGQRTRGGIGMSNLETLGAEAPVAVRVIIELNADYQEGLEAARLRVLESLGALDVGERFPGNGGGRHYVFVALTEDEVRQLESELAGKPSAPVLRIWRDQPLKPLLDRSIRTVKGDACMATFGADGLGIVVAVADSGIDGDHPHFAEFGNLEGLPPGAEHKDFTGGSEPLVDGYGHGTHVAGIVAGRTSAAITPIAKVVEVRNIDDSISTMVMPMAGDTVLRGVAPRATLVSLKVLDDDGDGYASALIAALEYVYDVNDAGRRVRIHCVNLSLGYPFDAEWFAAGHSPLCEVVNRLSRSGVVVVTAAGNDGSILLQTEGRANRQRLGLDQSINDPGNADEAITVGATHAESPHMYGVSYFSSRGPTADGRVKPDMVAPGERILSCAARRSNEFAKVLSAAGETSEAAVAYFREESGTSMAAPHVAGAVAALLSVRKEYVGRPEAVKEILMRSCTDLKRKADFQGAGLLDLLRALQSI